MLDTSDEVESAVLRSRSSAASSEVARARVARARTAIWALAIVGGGMRGAVSAAMCVVLEAVGLVGAFDRIAVFPRARSTAGPRRRARLP